MLQKLCKSISSVNIKNVMLCELLKDYPLKAQDIKRDILSPFSKIFLYKSAAAVQLSIRRFKKTVSLPAASGSFYSPRTIRTELKTDIKVETSFEY